MDFFNEFSFFRVYREDIGPQIPGQQPQAAQPHNYAQGMPPPSAYSAPQYYTPEQQQQQNYASPVPGTYNHMNNSPIPPPPSMGTPPIPPAAAVAPPPVTPAVRKMDADQERIPAEKKPRLEAEPEWQATQTVSF